MSAVLKRLVVAWVGLVLLLGLTVAASFILIGPASAAASLGIAFAKAALIFWFFMQLREEKGLIRIFAVGAAVWLMILVIFTAMEALSR
jgi:cytochrome c oxidase subunit 4